MLTFLEVNGSRVESSDSALAAWILALSAGTTPEQLAELIRAHLSAPLMPEAGRAVGEPRVSVGW